MPADAALIPAEIGVCWLLVRVCGLVTRLAALQSQVGIEFEQNKPKCPAGDPAAVTSGAAAAPPHLR